MDRPQSWGDVPPLLLVVLPSDVPLLADPLVVLPPGVLLLVPVVLRPRERFLRLEVVVGLPSAFVPVVAEFEPFMPSDVVVDPVVPSLEVEPPSVPPDDVPMVPVPVELVVESVDDVPVPVDCDPVLDDEPVPAEPVPVDPLVCAIAAAGRTAAAARMMIRMLFTKFLLQASGGARPDTASTSRRTSGSRASVTHDRKNRNTG